jgi:hypothetical protein
MKNIRWIVVLTAVVFALGTIACGGGGGKYADAKKAIANSNKILEDFFAEFDKADDAKSVAAALNGFVDDMEQVVPELRDLEKKYPEIGGGQSVPEELGEEGKKMMELWGKFGSIMMKIQQFGDDPEVKKAQERLQTVMSGL